ncbi:MAG TPA: 50S ribosomal protein L9 [Candidatus Paceibacterota bacterium]
MEIILLEDVAGVGRKHDIVTVSSGYGRNFLIPRKKAINATSSEINKIQEIKKAGERKKSEEQAFLETALTRITGKTFSIQEKANSTGGLFKSIGKEDISRILNAQEGIQVPAEMIRLKSPLKKTGEYTIEIKTPDNSGVMTLLVRGEEEAKTEKKKKK